MKRFTRYLLCAGLAALACGPGAVIAQTTVTINALPSANTPLAGTENVPLFQTGQCSAQSGTCQTTATNVGNASVLTGDATKSAGATAVTVSKTGGVAFATSATTDTTNAANISSGNLNIGRMPSIATATVLGNVSGSSASAVALNPLALANVQAAVISVYAASPSNIATLSGAATIDGVSVPTGRVILLAGQTTATQNGLWLVNSGAWTRPVNFPSGYVIPSGCVLTVIPQFGTVYGGHPLRLFNVVSPLTIDTTVQTWQDGIALASQTGVGGVLLTGTPTAQWAIGTQNGNSSTNGACPQWIQQTGTGLGSSLEDAGYWCGAIDSGGHPITSIASAAATPAVTGTGCSAASGATISDVDGAITATGVDTCTLTFGTPFPSTNPSGGTTVGPFCTVSGVGTTVLPTLNALPTLTAATFKTAAAGTFTYHCGS